MPLASIRAPFSHAEWIFELNWDGFGSMAYIDNGRCNDGRGSSSAHLHVESYRSLQNRLTSFACSHGRVRSFLGKYTPPLLAAKQMDLPVTR